MVRNTLLVLTLSAFALLSIVSMVPAFALSTTPVGQQPHDIAVDNGNHHVYVADNTDGTIFVIDGSSTTYPVFTIIPVLSGTSSSSGPSGVDIDQSTHTVYVSNNADGALNVIDGSLPIPVITNTVSLDVGSWGVAVDQGNHNVFVANNLANTLSVVSGGIIGNSLITSIPTGASPQGVAIDQSTHTIYVVNNGGNSMTVIDGSSPTYPILATISLSSTSPWGVAVDQSNHKVYVSNNDGTMTVIDGSSPTYPILATIPVGSALSDITINSSTHQVYVSDIGGSQIFVIDGSSSLYPTIAIPDGATPWGIAIDQSTSTAYVADNTLNQVVEIPIGTQTITPTTTTVSSSQNTALLGQSLTFTATISPLSATGTVQFIIDGLATGSPVPVSGGIATFTTSTLTAGTHSISASYSGDSNNGPSGSSTITIMISSSTPGKVTGGGHIGKDQNFGFEVNSDDGKKFTGNLEYHDKGAHIDLDTKKITMLAVYNSGMSATFAGQGTLDDHSKTLYSFLVQVTESNVKGGHDTFSIVITDNNGHTIYQNSGNVQGEIEIHKTTPKNSHNDNDDDHRHHDNHQEISDLLSHHKHK